MGEKAEEGNCSTLQQEHVPSPQQLLCPPCSVVCVAAARLWSRSGRSCQTEKVGFSPSFFFLDWSVPQSGSLCHLCTTTLSCCPPLWGFFSFCNPVSAILASNCFLSSTFQEKQQHHHIVWGGTEGGVQLCLELDNFSLPLSTRVPACRQTAAKQSAQLCMLHPLHPLGCYCRSSSDISIFWQNFIWIINSFYKANRNQLADSM